MPKSRQKMKGIVVNLEVDVVKIITEAVLYEWASILNR